MLIEPGLVPQGYVVYATLLLRVANVGEVTHHDNRLILAVDGRLHEIRRLQKILPWDHISRSFIPQYEISEKAMIRLLTKIIFFSFHLINLKPSTQFNLLLGRCSHNNSSLSSIIQNSTKEEENRKLSSIGLSFQAEKNEEYPLTIKHQTVSNRSWHEWRIARLWEIRP